MPKYFDLAIYEYTSQVTGETLYQVEDSSGFTYAIAREVEPELFCVLDSRLNPDVDPDVLEWLENDPIDLDAVVSCLIREGYDCYRGWIK